MNGRDGNVYSFAGGQKQHPQTRTVETFTPYFASQLQGYIPKVREWLLDGLILRGTVCLFAGPAKIGKSLAIQQLLTAQALGIHWLGHATTPCRTFGLFTEDSQEELARRQVKINTYYDVEPTDYELNYSWDARDTKDGTLIYFEQYTDKPVFTPLWNQIWSHCDDVGVEMVGLDPTGVVFGGSENFRRQVTVFVRELHKQAARRQGAVILSAHPSKSDPKGYSGSTAWLACVRFAMSLGRPADYDPETNQPRNIRVLRGLGGNYGLGINVERIEYQDGVFVPADDPEASPKRRAPLTDQERLDLRYRLLEGLRRVLANGAKVPADELSPGSLPRRARASAEPMLNRVALNDLNRAQADLLDAGQVIRVEVAHRCLLRPAEGFAYPGEQPWLPAAGF